MNSTVYFETSGVLAWLFGEPGADEVRRVVDEADTVITSRLTLVEAGRALIRAEDEQRLSAAESRVLTGTLAAARSGWSVLGLSDEICERAAGRFPVEPVRSLDALHLASALAALAGYPDLAVLSFDDRVRKNCRALGLSLVPNLSAR